MTWVVHQITWDGGAIRFEWLGYIEADERSDAVALAIDMFPMAKRFIVEPKKEVS